MPRKGRAAPRGRPPIRVLGADERTAASTGSGPRAEVAIVHGAPGLAIERAAEVLRRHPRTRVLVLNLQDDEAFLASALAAAAARCRAGADGEAGSDGVLSARERQVLGLLARGHTRREIAERLAIGVKSVETYRSRLTRKLGLRTRAELVRYAMESGLLGEVDPGLSAGSAGRR
jgi:DNA-binding NarL/FixJ family response regulator